MRHSYLHVEESGGGGGGGGGGDFQNLNGSFVGVLVCVLCLVGDYLSKLENQSIYILREAFNKFENMAMLWSIGKDSTVLLWLARKAFLGHVPFPLVHVDTSHKIPSMIEYRDNLVRQWKLQLIVGKNQAVLDSGVTFSQRQSHPRRMLRHTSRKTASKPCSTSIISLASSSASVATKNPPAPKNVISVRVTKTWNGTLSLTSRPSYGTSSRPIMKKAPTFASIRCCTGRN